MRIVGDIEGNFFEQNPEVAYISPFKDLIDDLGGERASHLMWALYLLEDAQSEFSDMLRDEREQQVKENFLQDSMFDLSTIDHLREEYKRQCMSANERLLANWKRKIEERDKYILDLEYNIANADNLDTRLTKSKAIWDQYLSVEKQVIKEREEGRNWGDYQESAIEKL